jgi:Tfp pilus assembly protein PilF
MGMKPSYHLRLSREEGEASKKNAEILSNPMIKKAFEAVTMHNDLETAIHYARKAVESEPSEPVYREILGTFYYQQGNKQMALDEMLTAERLSSREDLKRAPGVLLSIAKLYVDFAEYAKAKEYITKVLSDNPSNLLAHLELAKLYEKTGELDRARQQYLLISESPNAVFRAKGTEGLERLHGR